MADKPRTDLEQELDAKLDDLNLLHQQHDASRVFADGPSDMSPSELAQYFPGHEENPLGDWWRGLDDPVTEFLDNNVLDIQYLIGADGSYTGAQLVLGVGGPDTRFNTWENRLVGHWGGEQATLYVDNSISDIIDDYLAEPDMMESLASKIQANSRPPQVRRANPAAVIGVQAQSSLSTNVHPAPASPTPYQAPPAAAPAAAPAAGLVM